MIKTVSLLSFLNSLISTLSALCNLYLQTTPPSVDLAFEAIPNLMSSCCVCSRILYFAVCVRVSCILHVLLSLMGTVVVPTKSCFNQWEFFPLGNLDWFPWGTETAPRIMLSNHDKSWTSVEFLVLHHFAKAVFCCHKLFNTHKALVFHLTDWTLSPPQAEGGGRRECWCLDQNLNLQPVK